MKTHPRGGRKTVSGRYNYNPRRELVQSDRQVGRRHTVTSYGYDLNHNRIKQNQTVYDNNGADQLLSFGGPSGSGSVNYNDQGQANQALGLTFSYNQSQQIKHASGSNVTAIYDYDGSGRRVAKEVNGKRDDYLLMGQEVLKTYEGGQLKADYFLGLGREGIKTGGAWNYYLSDGLGSTAMLTDEAGNAVAAWDYSDYGETSQLAGDSSVYNPFLYTGQEWDAELGMYNLRARHYAPTLGRFLARDPIGYGGGPNLYSYCGGDPINHSDPSGTTLAILGDSGLAAELIGQLQQYSGLSITSRLTNTDYTELTATGSPGSNFLAALLLNLNDKSINIAWRVVSGDAGVAFGSWGLREQKIDIADVKSLAATPDVPSEIVGGLLTHEIKEAALTQIGRFSTRDPAHQAAITYGENPFLLPSGYQRGSEATNVINYTYTDPSTKVKCDYKLTITGNPGGVLQWSWGH